MRTERRIANACSFYHPAESLHEGSLPRHTQRRHKALKILNTHILKIKERAICRKNNVLVPKADPFTRPNSREQLAEEIELKSERTTNSNAYRIVLHLTYSLFEILKSLQ